MKSMTGFGTHLEKSPEFEIQVTVRSVNGRFLEVKPHMPRAYQSVEASIKNTVKQTYKRGTVDVYIHRRSLKEATSEVVFNPGAAKQWQKAYAQLGKALKLDASISVQDIAGQADVFSVMDSQKVSDKENKVLMRALKQAIVLGDKEKQREGKALKSDVLGYLKGLTHSLKTIKVQAGTMKTKIEDRLRVRLSKVLADEDLDPQRLAQEVAVLVDKADVAEEISRLEEHLKHMKGLIKSGGSMGKKMDFYCQELLREFNTIGSKSVFAELTAEVLNAKSGIESLREQVQNIE